jgi:hypothetical protein
MQSSHILMSVLSLFVMVGLASAVPAGDTDQRGGPPKTQTGQAAKPPKPPQATKPAPAPAPQAKGPQTASQHLVAQPKLAAKLQPLLPPATNLQTASAGFKNLGQFVAAVHVSHNLSIPFDQLKLRLTGPEPVSLGKAIQELKPGVNAAAEVKRAEAQARKDQEGGR